MWIEFLVTPAIVNVSLTMLALYASRTSRLAASIVGFGVILTAPFIMLSVQDVSISLKELGKAGITVMAIWGPGALMATLAPRKGRRATVVVIIALVTSAILGAGALFLWLFLDLTLFGGSLGF